jgi:hypothetical protein
MVNHAGYRLVISPSLGFFRVSLMAKVRRTDNEREYV